MYKYLPTENMKSLKMSLNDAISENNISSNKISKAMGVDTSHLKVLRDPENVKLEISPEQYTNLVKYLGPKKVELDLGEEPENFFDKFIYYLFKKGYTFDEFCSKAGKNKTEIKKMFAPNGVRSMNKEVFINILSDEEFNNLNNYNSIILTNDRDAKVIRNINSSTLVNVFMVKRGYSKKDLAIKCLYNISQIESILEGFILDSNLMKVSEALKLPLSTLDNVVLNSWDPNNNFGYFLQKTIFESKHNIYSMAEKIGMNYCDLKGIVSGTRNIKGDEFEKIANGLNIDPDDIRMKAPQIVEGDDKYIPWNFVKWTVDHPELTLEDLTKLIHKDAGSLIERIRTERKYKLPEIDVLMSLTGLTKSQLRAKVSDEEIEKLKSTKRKSGRRYSGDPDSFDMFIRNHINEKGLTISEFAELVGVDRTTLANWIKNAKVQEKVLENILLILDLSKDDIKKFKVSTFKKCRQKKKKDDKTLEIKDETFEEKDVEEENKEDPNLFVKYIAHSIFNEIKDGSEVRITYHDEEARALIDNEQLRNEVINYMNIILVDNMMADREIISEKKFEPGSKETYLCFYLNRELPDPDKELPVYHPSGDKSIYSSISYNSNILEELVTSTELDDVPEDVKEFMMEELDKFLELFSNLTEMEQCTLIRMMNLIKNPNDIKMENIPEECFLLGKFAEYKKIDFLVKLIGLDN